MDYGLYRYDEPYARPVRRRINYFAWTVAILLLTGFAFAAWLGSFYIFSQPERPDSYRILQKLQDRKSTRLNSSHVSISYAVFCLKKKKNHIIEIIELIV